MPIHARHLLRLLTPFACLALLAAVPLRASTAGTKTIIFFGDSLTAGYGLHNPSSESYPALIQEKIRDARVPWRVVNAGVSGETTAAGLRRVDWVLRQPVDVFVLALGGNDMLRGIDPVITRSNLQGIIDRVRAKYPTAKVVLAGMEVPTTMGPAYVESFRAVFPDVARKNAVALIPFLLEGVGGREQLNQPDGIHPTAKGHAMMADHVWKFLHPLL